MAPRGRVAQGPKLRTEFAEMDTPTPMLSMLVCRVCVRVHHVGDLLCSGGVDCACACVGKLLVAAERCLHSSA